MALSWDARKSLLRLTGIVEELLASARGPQAPSGTALSQQLSALEDQAQMLLGQDDPTLADEFERMVSVSDELPAELHAAALAGWLKACLAVESAEDKRAEAMTAQEAPRRRKQTIGFKIRSPITREETGSEESPGRADS